MQNIKFSAEDLISEFRSTHVGCDYFKENGRSGTLPSGNESWNNTTTLVLSHTVPACTLQNRRKLRVNQVDVVGESKTFHDG